jgi:hypothetical protein
MGELDEDETNGLEAWLREDVNSLSFSLILETDNIRPLGFSP